MIEAPQFAGSTIAVLGLGRSGLAAARALAASKADVRAWDDDAPRRAAAQAAGITITDLAGGRWEDMDALVLSPGIPHTHPEPHPLVAEAKRAGCTIMCDIEILARARGQASFIGVTGTNGKSTTTALLGHILKSAGRHVAIGGNIGTPALDLPALDESGTYVLELSSYQLELMTTPVFDVAVVINISPDHLDRHGGMDGYAAAKRRLLGLQRTPATLVIGIDDPHCRTLWDAARKAASPARIFPISNHTIAAGGVYVSQGALIDDTAGDAQTMFDLRNAPALPGVHNGQNAAAAYAVARALGVSPQHILDGLRSFPGLAHRQELVATRDGVRYINDSKATNADAAARALACYDSIYWIAGGRAKAGGIGALAPWFDRIRHSFLIGEAAADFAATLDGVVPVTLSGDLATATRQAHEMARADGHPDAVVLLSPACASFDQWSDFEARGNAFRGRVKELLDAAGGKQASC